MCIYCTARLYVLTLVLVLTILRNAASFNVEGNNNVVKYLPGIKDGTAKNSGQNNGHSAFYGYSLEFTAQKE